MLTRGSHILALILNLAAVGTQARAPQEPQMLVAGNPVDREIEGGKSHTYQIKLAAGQFLKGTLPLAVKDNSPNRHLVHEEKHPVREILREGV